ncbi:hypothetical protein MAMP_00761 [Methylophaga aminisulfidivorans MP]|uniref:Uncharacterized protein n=1 Tax=Methylophaga aminisulfidivorans MP TaxID=1026882 RepID=F5T2T2_9GAMM|nr:hypothetical protein MAMP_00761 [Methylophaga aminisulfidivorans MP]
MDHCQALIPSMMPFVIKASRQNRIFFDAGTYPGIFVFVYDQ